MRAVAGGLQSKNISFAFSDGAVHIASSLSSPAADTSRLHATSLRQTVDADGLLRAMHQSGVRSDAPIREAASKQSKSTGAVADSASMPPEVQAELVDRAVAWMHQRQMPSHSLFGLETTVRVQCCRCGHAYSRVELHSRMECDVADANAEDSKEVREALERAKQRRKDARRRKRERRRRRRARKQKAAASGSNAGEDAQQEAMQDGDAAASAE